MFAQRSSAPVSRRVALAGIGAGGLGVAVGLPARQAEAENPDLAAHPLTGVWLVTMGETVAPTSFGADGSVQLTCPVCERGVSGSNTFVTPGVGTWTSTGGRGGYFNVVHVLTDETGRFAGTRSMHCYPVVSEDGTSFADDGSKIRIYVRDESNSLMAILGEDGNSAPISAVRMSPGSPGFPGPTGSPAEV